MHQRLRQRVVLLGGLHDYAGIHGFNVAASEFKHDAALPCLNPLLRHSSKGSTGCQRFKASHIAAVVQRAILVDGHVAYLTAEAVCARVEVSADDDATADARANGHIDHVVASPARSECMLAERAERGIVLCIDGQRQAFLQHRYWSEEMPLRSEIRRVVHYAGARLHGAGKGQAHTFDFGSALGCNVLKRVGEPVHHRCPAFARQCFCGMSDHYGACGIHKRDTGPGASNVGNEGVFGHRCSLLAVRDVSIAFVVRGLTWMNRIGM